MIILIWLILGVSASFIASSKGYNREVWFCLGVVFGIISLGVVLFLPDKNDAI